MKRRLSALAAVFLLLSLVLPPGLAADGPAGAVTFESGPPGADGVFEVSLTFTDVTFRVFQFALRYDTDVIQPVARSGEPATGFWDFAEKCGEWLSTVGTELNPSTGLIDLAGYTMPGTRGDALNEDSEIVAGSGGLTLFTFRFKRLKEGDTGLQIATEEKGEPFRPACPQGAIVADNEGHVTVDITFREAAAPEAATTETFTGQAPPAAPAKTVDGLLREAILLKIGSHAAVTDGGVVAIYPGEKSVTAYVDPATGRTYVPLRFVAERLGSAAEWENDTKTAVITKGGHTVRMTVGSDHFTLDGGEQTLDAPAALVADRVMVPIRFISEAFGYEAIWDNARRIAVLAPKSLRWEEAGSVEEQALNEAVRLLAMYSNFV